ncbi:MAG TPA: LysR family transcriptional regulator [Rudaea sp.]|nr:LysR family transcriptional regulator [Rudaea sp.]
MATSKSASPIRLRLIFDSNRAFGPGKADLLQGIDELGSIAAAGRALSMSYKRAWQLVDDLNKSFAAPLVRASKGGGHGGGATLTVHGEQVLKLYRDIERKTRRSAAAEIKRLQSLAGR